jgi:hypothetical protein
MNTDKLRIYTDLYGLKLINVNEIYYLIIHERNTYEK